MLRRMLAAVTVFTTVLGVAGSVRAAAADPEIHSEDPTPPRLSYTAGPVSFWRPGGDDWAPAQVNTPLAEGDELYTARDGNLELQVGPRAFVRAWGDTQLGLTHHEPGFLQLRVAAGYLAFDLHTLDPGEVIEVATPTAALTIDQPGYYRVDVTAERTALTVRRSGRAGLTIEGGPASPIGAGETAVVEAGLVRRGPAPVADVWDRWNETRTASLVAPVTAQHVSSHVYGASELDRHGTWRADATYGSIWVPAGVAPGWAPYTTGRWIWDPRFGWTWLDTAPWGWAPYHYGRWVWVGGVWGWAPGPVVVRPAYAPALVVFFGTPAVGVHVAGPSVGWVALGWGEPVVPWWGRPHFVGRPWWGGWGGPRTRQVAVYRNVSVVNAVVVVRSEHFGRRSVHETRLPRSDVRQLQPVRGRLAVRPEPESFRGRDGRAQRPPEGQLSRRVVATRPPVQRPDPFHVREDRPAARSEDRRDARPEERRQAPTPRAEPRRPEPSRMETPRPVAPRIEPPRRDAPRVESPRPAPGGPEGPRVTPPRVEPRRPEPPSAEGPRVAPPRVEPRRAGPPSVEGPRPAPPGVAPRRPEAPSVEAPRPAPRVEPRRQEGPRPEPRIDSRAPAGSRGQAPSRAAAPAGRGRPEALRPAVQQPRAPRDAAPARPGRAERPERGEARERARGR